MHTYRVKCIRVCGAIGCVAGPEPFYDDMISITGKTFSSAVTKYARNEKQNAEAWKREWMDVKYIGADFATVGISDEDVMLLLLETHPLPTADYSDAVTEGWGAREWLWFNILLYAR